MSCPLLENDLPNSVFSGGYATGKQGRCGHTCYFCMAAGPAKMLVGELPKPAGLRDSSSQTSLSHFGTKCPKVPPLRCSSSPHKIYDFAGIPQPKVPALCACCLRPGLSLRGLIFPPVYVRKNVDNISYKRGKAYKHIGVSLFTHKKCWY